MRRQTSSPESDDKIETKPLAFSIGSDEEEAGDYTPSAPPPLYRPVREGRSRRAYVAHVCFRILVRVFPPLLFVIVITSLIITLLPGGWRVGLCAMDLLPPPAWGDNAVGGAGWNSNTTLIGHRGSEFPYPENSLDALIHASEATHFVEMDIALTSDAEIIVLHDSTFNRTTNGTGPACMHSADYARSLELNVPTRDPRGRLASGRACSRRRGGATYPCLYRVAFLKDVFDVVAKGTRFMLDVKECYAPGVTVDTPVCTNCTTLMVKTRELMERHFIRADRVVFTSTEKAALQVFWKGMPRGSSYALSTNLKYSHYRRDAFMEVLKEGEIDSVAMYIGLAAMRPDLVRAVMESKTADERKVRTVYAWTIRKELDYRLARCAGVRDLIVAEPERMKKRFVRGMSEPVVTGR